MSGVVVEVRVKEGHEIKKGDPVCGKFSRLAGSRVHSNLSFASIVLSAMKVGYRL